MNSNRFVSIIIPCRNEEKHIAMCLESITNNDYPQNALEVLVVDGMSDDESFDIIQHYAKLYGFIIPLKNPKKFTSNALNIGLDNAKGNIIIIMGAHTHYPPNYISGLVSWLEKTDADVVGGICITRPARDTAKAQAIAIGLSHPFGIGNSYFRIGVNKPRWVDTVPFGCYRREVFERIGAFDEELVRNQDDELNLRLLKNGGRILLVPEIVSYYYARESLTKLWRMYYRYGYFKPLIARKIGGILTLRQIVPATLMLALLFTGFLAIWSPRFISIFQAILFGYILADLAFSASQAFIQGIKCGLWLILVFPVIHFSYGLGFLKGVLDFLIYRKGPRRIVEVTISR